MAASDTKQESKLYYDWLVSDSNDNCLEASICCRLYLLYEYLEEEYSVIAVTSSSNLDLLYASFRILSDILRLKICIALSLRVLFIACKY